MGPQYHSGAHRGDSWAERHEAARWRPPVEGRRRHEQADVAALRGADRLGGGDRAVHLLALHHVPSGRVPVNHFHLEQRGMEREKATQTQRERETHTQRHTHRDTQSGSHTIRQCTRRRSPRFEE